MGEAQAGDSVSCVDSLTCLGFVPYYQNHSAARYSWAAKYKERKNMKQYTSRQLRQVRNAQGMVVGLLCTTVAVILISITFHQAHA